MAAERLEAIFLNCMQIRPYFSCVPQTEGTIMRYCKFSTPTFAGWPHVTAGADRSRAFRFPAVRGPREHRINARRNNKRITNFLFADSHAESIDTKSTPDLTVAQWRTGPDTRRHPLWRLAKNNAPQNLQKNRTAASNNGTPFFYLEF